ncbi:RBBP9/YdeN family alpha/beta hydrolase [Dyella sp.]|uniref:RBBP9/YdeN family alpha/beta hydrolase n=1 Tax=Dyella sp. TaxID=1869338 RepID=UPI002B46A5AB|nr:alpha/beta hydrolase [Dyella sp.]HKT27878.1 alpha/beta hydrolase [Dyella sp.]
MHEPRQTHGTTPSRVLLVPGIGNSGPTHWQSYWESEHDSYARVHQNDWERPVCADWVSALERTAQRAEPGALIAAHSLGCLVVANWLAQTSIRIAGALLVAVPDPSGVSFPTEAKGFTPVPLDPLPCPSIVVASSNDPYSDIAFATQCAHAWGSRLINIGRAGHINAASGLGHWDNGQRMLRSLLIEA